MKDEEIEDRFAAIETKLAYLEDFVARLQSEVVVRNGEVDRLIAEHSAIKDKLIQLSSELEEVPNRKPPHY